MWFIYQFNKRLFFFKNEKGKLAAKNIHWLVSKSILLDKWGQTRGIFEDVQKGSKRVQICFHWKPRTSESAVKKKQVNCSFKMFLLLTVWYKEGGGEHGGGAIIKTKNWRQEPQCVTLYVCQVVPAKELTICRSQRTKWRKLGRGWRDGWSKGVGVVERGGGGVEKCCCCCWRRVQVVLSSTLYPGVALWEAECRWLPSLLGMDVLSFPLDLWPCVAPPSWVSASDALPEELSCTGAQVTGESVKHRSVFPRPSPVHDLILKPNVLQTSSCSFCRLCHPQHRPSRALSPGQGALGPVVAHTELYSMASIAVHLENTCRAQHSDTSGLLVIFSLLGRQQLKLHSHRQT